MTRKEYQNIIAGIYPLMYRVALALTDNADEACDLTQETLLKLWTGRDRLAGAANPEAYCMAALRNRFYDMARARSCDGLAVAVSEDMPLADNVAGDIVGIRSDLDLALKLMASLPEAQQRVVRLSSVGGCSNDEIAELTGFSPANVRTLLSRGRKRIRELFIKYSE